MKQSAADWYCPMPFKHAFVHSLGISPCCRIQRQPVALEAWKDNEILKRIQQDTLQGKIPNECKSCYEEEEKGYVSLRQIYLNDYKNQKFDYTDIDWIDYRYSNLCNFKCRSCGPEFSHLIKKETLQNSDLRKFFYIQDNEKYNMVSESNVDWILTNLNQINKLMFTGGEPTVIPEVRRIIEQLLVSSNHHTKILITSNCSFTDTFWLDLVDRLPDRLHWTISLDAISSAAEIVRHGTVWPIVEKNIEWLSKNAESVNINTVITNLNIYQLKPLLSWCCELREMSKFPGGKHGSDGLRHQFAISSEAKISAINWPEQKKIELINYLQSCLDLPLDQEQVSTIKSLINQITNKKFDDREWAITQEYHALLDAVRGENHESLLP